MIHYLRLLSIKEWTLIPISQFILHIISHDSPSVWPDLSPFGRDLGPSLKDNIL
jgi:hypothetical protein